MRRAGEKDEALEVLARAVSSATTASAHRDLYGSPLWDRMGGRLDPVHTGEAWTEHKAHQVNEAVSLMRRTLIEEATSPDWRNLAGDDPRCREIDEAAARLSDENVTSHEA